MMYSSPFHYDPTDDSKEVFGRVITNLLCVPTMPKAPHADDLLAHLTYQEITGYDALEVHE